VFKFESSLVSVDFWVSRLYENGVPSLVYLTGEWTANELGFVLKLHPGAGTDRPSSPTDDGSYWVRHDHCQRDDIRLSYTWLIDIVKEADYRYLAFVTNSTKAIQLSELMVFSQLEGTKNLPQS